MLEAQDVECYHCGEICSDSCVRLNEKYFCCNGCKAVYELLDYNEMDTYYCLEDQPGTTFKQYPNTGHFDYLEEESVIERLIDFKNKQFTSVSFYIPNIHCTSCVWLLENLFKLDAGITKSSVNFLKRELSISFREDQTSLRSIVELLSSIGYEPELRLEKLDPKKVASPNRRLWLKLGVAGFAFGNIMLFSFPEYLSGSTLSSQGSFHIFFGILNIALALPVLLYSSSDYLKSAWAAVKQGGINLDVPISIGILSLFGRSAYEIISGAGAGYMDSLTGLVFFLLIGRLIQKKTYERLSFDRDYKSYLPLSVTVLDKENSAQTKSIDQIEKGMRLLIRNQELVPADAILLSETGFVDYSYITGESEPVEIQAGESIYAGGKVIGPSIEMKATKKVSNSYLTKLWNNAAFEDPGQKPPVSSLADRISPHFTLAVIGIAVTAGILWLPVGMERALTVFTSVLIIACPCALALATPFTLGSTLGILSKNGLYIKGVEVLERLANAASVVFDKTGTLTKADEAEVQWHGQPLSDSERLLIASACRQSVHPLSQKITANLNIKNPVTLQSFEEVINNGIIATASGTKIVLGSSAFVEEHTDGRDTTKGNHRGAASVVHISVDGNWKGWFEISNRYRTGITQLLNTLKHRFSTYLLSGDNDSQKSLFVPFFNKDTLRFSQSPQQKLDFIKALQNEDGTVIMVGDGLNDAGALRQSDFGIALTENIHSFTPACDAILEGSRLGNMDKFINFSQAGITIIKISFAISLLYNIVGLSYAVAGQLSPLVAAILMPLSSISIMLFTTAGTHLTAKKMGLLSWK